VPLNIRGSIPQVQGRGALLQRTTRLVPIRVLSLNFSRRSGTYFRVCLQISKPLAEDGKSRRATDEFLPLKPLILLEQYITNQSKPELK
jgi:hypothetical protein